LAEFGLVARKDPPSLRLLEATLAIACNTLCTPVSEAVVDRDPIAETRR